MNRSNVRGESVCREEGHLADVKLAAAKMPGPVRRAFEAEMVSKYCEGNAWWGEQMFGWSRHTIAPGLKERRSGMICPGAREAFSGHHRWEEKHAQAAEALRGDGGVARPAGPGLSRCAGLHPIDGQGGARTTAGAGFCRGRAAGAVYDGRRAQPQRLPAAPGTQGQAPKKILQTDAIFANVRARDGQGAIGGAVKRLSIDCKATVKIGLYSRGGKTRGDDRALDHDTGCREKYTPFGIVDEDSGELALTFGSSARTSDFIVNALVGWWDRLPPEERQRLSRLRIKADNGPESHGRRPRFLERMVAFADRIDKPIQLPYFPPYHGKYNPIERCRGILEQHWNGARLIDVDAMLGWARSMAWKGLHPVVELTRTVCEKGVALSKKAMPAVEARLDRNPSLPDWDILIRLA